MPLGSKEFRGHRLGLPTLPIESTAFFTLQGEGQIGVFFLTVISDNNKI